MTRPSIVRMTSIGFILGGVFVAGWTLISPWGSFAGADRGGSTQWVVAHASHYLAALSMLFGLLGLAVQRLPAAGKLETGAQLFFLVVMWIYGGTGAMTTALWPLIAHHAGYIVEPTGAMFAPRPELLQTAAVPALSIGIALLLFTMWKVRILPLAGMIVGVLGAALFWVPTAPLSDSIPWIFFPASGTLAGIGLAWLGFSLRNGAAPAAGAVPASPQAARQPAMV